MSEHQVIYSKKLRKHIYLRAATPAAAALPDASPATCREAIKIIRPLPVLPLHSAAAPYLSPSPTIYSSAELYPHGPHVMCLPFASPTHYLPPLYLHRGCAANHGLLGHHGFVPPIIPPSVHRAPPPPPPSIFYRGHDRVLLGPDLELTRVSSSCSIQMPSSPESCSAVETLSPASSENIQAEKKTRKRRQRADDLIPPGVDLSIDDIANSKMDEFNAKIADKPEPLQLKLKDSRRRKKNRVSHIFEFS